jgi:ribosomal protein L31E
LIRWLKTAKSIDQLKEFIKNHFKLDEEKYRLLPEDMKKIFDFFV